MSEKETGLIAIENINALELFTKDGLDPILKRIEKEVSGFVPDLTTDKGRKECASTARSVSRAKVILETAGKNLVAGWKEKAKVVDASRRVSREFLDDLRDRVRQPLTDWEAAEKIKAEAQRRKDELDYLHGEAIADDQIRTREAVVAEKEAEFERKEAEAAEKEAAEREKAEAAEREKAEAKEKVKREAAEAERIKKAEKEAAERARLEAASKIAQAQERANRAEQERKDAAEKADQYLKDAAERAKKDAAEAAEKARREKQEAIQKEREAAEERERERLAVEKAEREKAERKAANVEHRRGINVKILEALSKNGIGDRTAKKVVTLIATGSIPNVTINY